MDALQKKHIDLLARRGDLARAEARIAEEIKKLDLAIDMAEAELRAEANKPKPEAEHDEGR